MSFHTLGSNYTLPSQTIDSIALFNPIPSGKDLPECRNVQDAGKWGNMKEDRARDTEEGALLELFPVPNLRKRGLGEEPENKRPEQHFW